MTDRPHPNLPAARDLPLPASYGPPDGSGGGRHQPYATEDAAKVDLQGVLQTLRRNFWIILIVTLITGAIATRLALGEPPRYSATSTLRIMDERRMLTGGMDMGFSEAAIGRQADPILTQVQVLRSRAIMSRVVDRVGLNVRVIEGTLPRSMFELLAVPETRSADPIVLSFGDTAVTASWSGQTQSAAYGDTLTVAGLALRVTERPEGEEATISVLDQNVAVGALIDGLRARPRERTDLIDLEYISHDPLLAQQVVNATAEVFAERSQESAREQSRRRRTFVEARLEETELVLTAAQQALIDFQRREQVYSSAEQFAAQQVNVNNLELRQEELSSERRMFASLLSALREGGTQASALRTVIASPGIASNPVVSQLYTQLMNAEARRDSMRAGGSSATNPDMIAVGRLIETTQDHLVAAVQSHVASLDAQISAVTDIRTRHQAALSTMPATQAEESRLQLELETVRRMSDQLREEVQRARIAEAVEAGQVEIVDLAPGPGAPVSRNAPRTIALGVILGLMLGSGIGLAREKLNTSIRRRDEIEAMLGVPSLGVIPKIASGVARNRVQELRARRTGGTQVAIPQPGAVDTSLVTVLQTHSAAAEAFRTLRTNLIFSQTTNRFRSLVVTSSSAGEGKSTTAANLAISYAQQGLRVLLVDCDLRRPRLHQLFGLDKSPGLTELVFDAATLDEAVRPTLVPNLFVVSSGAQPPNPTELVGGPRFRTAVSKLSEGFDMVICDTPPVLAAAEGAILGARSDGVVMVIRAGKTDRAAAQQALTQLRTVSANVVGVVLNDADGKVPKYGGYQQYYYTYYGAEEVASG